jgi:hypothetical protein
VLGRADAAAMRAFSGCESFDMIRKPLRKHSTHPRRRVQLLLIYEAPPVFERSSTASFPGRGYFIGRRFCRGSAVTRDQSASGTEKWPPARNAEATPVSLLTSGDPSPALVLPQTHSNSSPFLHQGPSIPFSPLSSADLLLTSFFCRSPSIAHPSWRRNLSTIRAPLSRRTRRTFLSETKSSRMPREPTRRPATG